MITHGDGDPQTKAEEQKALERQRKQRRRTTRRKAFLFGCIGDGEGSRRQCKAIPEFKDAAKGKGKGRGGKAVKDDGDGNAGSVARPFKPITAWLTSQAAAKMAASPDMAGDAALQATAGMAASPDMVEDITEQPRVFPVVLVSKCSHQRSKRRDRRLV